MEKKIAKKYADLIVQANNSTGRKEALSLIKQATKLKTKLDQYEMQDIQDEVETSSFFFILL